MNIVPIAIAPNLPKPLSTAVSGDAKSLDALADSLVAQLRRAHEALSAR